MSANRFIPDPEEQAEEILRILRDRGAVIPEDLIEPADVVDLGVIDPEKPVSLNLRRVGIAIGAVRPDDDRALERE